MDHALIPSAVRIEVQHRLDAIEAEENVRVFYACESGSRAWGFASQDSDFDVRFLYAHPPSWYLSIQVERKRDVIERPISDELDVSGWDLRKALQLFRKSNPPLLEWLRSPLVYREKTDVTAQFRGLVATHFSARASAHHYFHMARSNFRDYLRGEEVWRKKYFYVLRPLLAVRWIDAGLGPVPMEFETVVDRLVEPGPLREAIETLLVEKRNGAELDRGPRIPPISDFIEVEMERLEPRLGSLPAPKTEAATLDRFFRQALATLWPGTPVPLD